MQQPASNSHSSGAKYAVKASDMSDEMQKDAIDMAIEVRLLVSMRSRSSAGPNWCVQSTSKWDTERDIAASLKKDFDAKYGPTWHCIVGSNFGSYVTHESRHFIYFYLNKLAILLYKSG
mmetsp:Transcript_8532/g.17074  ORF Transcript_8532/g.17074 Transcript_8532/m.17074 type:complete len:119 (-) Transcript_8532:1925-2281(-)